MNKHDQQQRQLTDYIRHGKAAPDMGSSQLARMQVYRDTFHAGMQELLSNCFPVTQEILGEEKWGKLVSDFYANHHAKTPLFHQIPEELLTYLWQERDEKNDPNYLKELAHYEWLELAVEYSEVDGNNNSQPVDKIKYDVLAVTPTAQIMAYHYPVHQINKDFQPTQPEPTFICCYRDQDDQVELLVINAITAQLLLFIQNTPMPLKAAIASLPASRATDNVYDFLTKNQTILHDLCQRGVLVQHQGDETCCER